MTEYVLMICLGLIVVSFVSRNKIAVRLEEFSIELAGLKGEERKAAGQRRQAEGVVLSMEMQEREIKQANKKLKQQVSETKRWVEEFRAVATMGAMGAEIETES